MALDLENWLKRATRGLAPDSASKVRDEIGQHYELAREDGMAAGLSPAEANRSAVAVLGNPWAANIRYRRILMTVLDAGMLNVTKKEGRFGRLLSEASWLFMLLLATSWRAVSLGLCLLLLTLLLSVWTPSRTRFFRYLRWSLLAGLLPLVFGSGISGMAKTLLIGGWYVWIEWRGAALRRKLPVEQWPRQLHL